MEFLVISENDLNVYTRNVVSKLNFIIPEAFRV